MKVKPINKSIHKKLFKLSIEVYPGSWHDGFYFNARDKQHADSLAHDWARYQGQLPSETRTMEVAEINERVIANIHNEHMEGFE